MRRAGLAKKKTAKKKTTKTSPRSTKSTRGAGASSAAKSKKNTTKKTAKKTAKKTTKKIVKKAASKKVTKKKVSKKVASKATTKKAASKKPATKVAKKVVKKTVKKVAKKPAVKKAAAKKPASKKITKKTAKKTTKKTTSAASAKNTKPKANGTPAAAENAKSATPAKGGSGPGKRRRPSKVKKPLILPDRPLLLGPNGPALKPLIPSGAKVKKKKSVLDNVTSRRTKTPLTKAQLEHYRQILLLKRAELLGDMRHLEDEALRGDSGSTSHSSQHLAEQGSENYEQSLNLNLAASDRERINEIDDALKRIADRTYGLCELTHEPIKKARLDELPWARYTIVAARELDQRGGKL